MALTSQNRMYSLLFAIITIVCHSQCPEQNAKCADVAYNGVIWGTHNANGIDVSSYTNNELSFIGCGGGCGQSSFTCTDTSSMLEFGTFQTGAGGSFPMDAQLQALTTSTFECSADGNPETRRRLSHAPGDQHSVDALCHQLGYATGEFVEADWGNGCPDVDYNPRPTNVWWSDFTPTPKPMPQGAHRITCLHPRGLQAPCEFEADCCGDLLCDLEKCCIPEETDIYDCEMDDNNCCSNLFCNSDGICNDCRTQGGACDQNSDCCDETLGIVCRFNGMCDWCSKLDGECDVSNDCCDNLTCNEGERQCIEPTMEPTMAPSTKKPSTSPTMKPTMAPSTNKPSTSPTTTPTKKPTGSSSGSSSGSSESSDSSSSEEVSNALMNNDKPGDNDAHKIETQKLSDLMSGNIWIITLVVFILIFVCCVLICILRKRKTEYRTATIAKLPPIDSSFD